MTATDPIDEYDPLPPPARTVALLPTSEEQPYRFPIGIAIVGGVALVFAILGFRDDHIAFGINALLVAAACGSVAGGWAYLINRRGGVRWRVARHLGPRWPAAVSLTHPVPLRDRVNVQLALDALRAADPAAPPPVGITAWNGLHAAARTNAWPVPLQYTSHPVALGKSLACADNGLYFLRLADGRPFLAAFNGHSRQVEFLAADQPTAEAALAAVVGEAGRRNVYRGAVLSVEYPGGAVPGQDPDFAVRFHDMPPVGRGQIVLPEKVMGVLERNVLGLLAHAETLRRAGRSTRHGVLLHGPPGTGKTLVTRYLARACPNYTVVLLTGRQLGLIRESCQLAKLLAPSVIVLEDVDLIATSREQSFDNKLLHDLMDEMDGLGAKADVIFLLTTNRPRVLEGALAGRPGRVDQAVYFPLPDRDCRGRLFDLYAHGLDLSAVSFGPLLERTEGASPAFIQELFRKAALFAAERGEASDPLRLTDADFEAAVSELIEFGGALTRNLLGYRADPDAAGGRMGFRAE